MSKQKKITKEKLEMLIDDFHVQIEIICLCIDMIDAIYEIGDERIKKEQVTNFFEITRSSLVFRYEIELVKITNGQEKFSISKLLNYCNANPEHFYCTENELTKICKDIKNKLKKYNKLNYNLKERRDQALAHNDIEHYYYNETYLNRFPLNYDEIKDEAKDIYNFSRILQNKINSRGSKHYYPTHPDDIKRLFNMKTDVEIEDEKTFKEIIENWNKT